jgi:hypothetical protein
MTVLCSPIPGSEVAGIDGEPDHLGDYIEDNIASNLPGAKMSVEQQEAEFLRSMRDWPGAGPQLTGHGWRMLIRAAEREKAAFQKSKQAAIEQYGAVLVNAAERWAQPRHPEVSYAYLAGLDPYEFYIRMYRRGYRQAMWDAESSALGRRSKSETRPPLSRLDLYRTARAIRRLQDGPLRPFVGAYLLEARRD